MNGETGTGGRVAVGGCRCGAVAVRASENPTVVVYCHCQDCRKSSGAPVSLFVGYRTGQVEWLQGEPRVYESSPGVYRSFCGRCGAPVSFEDERLPGETYLPVGIFDDPETFEPEKHDWVSRRLRWFDVPDGLPRHEESSILR
jgi:hypothetical protein